MWKLLKTFVNLTCDLCTKKYILNLKKLSIFTETFVSLHKNDFFCTLFILICAAFCAGFFEKRDAVSYALSEKKFRKKCFVFYNRYSKNTYSVNCVKLKNNYEQRNRTVNTSQCDGSFSTACKS